jgi:hypothetical protein
MLRLLGLGLPMPRDHAFFLALTLGVFTMDRIDGGLVSGVLTRDVGVGFATGAGDITAFVEAVT